MVNLQDIINIMIFTTNALYSRRLIIWAIFLLVTLLTMFLKALAPEKVEIKAERKQKRNEVSPKLTSGLETYISNQKLIRSWVSMLFVSGTDTISTDYTQKN